MTRTARAIAHLAAGLAVAVVGLAGCSRGTLGEVGAGGAGQINTGRGAGPGGSVALPDGGWISTGGVFGDGAGGRGGTGRGGAGAAGGFGGTGQVCIYPSNCGPLCGNGRIDSCTVLPGPGCFPATVTELCDGADLGVWGDFCEDEGFPSGKAVCGSDCSPTCSECVPGLPSVQSCGVLPPSPSFPNLGRYAIDATESEVGLAEVRYDDLDHWQLSFRRLTPALAVASDVTLLGTSELPAAVYVSSIAVAPLPSGWVIAACLNESLEIFSVDAAGANPQRAALPLDGSFACVYGSLSLAARPGGGPLLLWEDGYSVFGAFVAAGGRSVGAPFEIFGPSPYGRGLADAAWVGDAFQFVMAVYAMDGSSASLRLTHIDPNGSPVTSRQLLKDDIYSVPMLARGAPDVRLTYVGSLLGMAGTFEDPAIKWKRLGPMDQLLGDATLTGLAVNLLPSPSVAFGDDTVVLLADVPASLSIARIGPDGRLVGVPYEVLRGPPYSLGAGVSFVRRGPDVIVSWPTEGALTRRLGLARITP